MTRHALPALAATAVVVALLVLAVHWALSGLDAIVLGGAR